MNTNLRFAPFFCIVMLAGFSQSVAARPDTRYGQLGDAIRADTRKWGNVLVLHDAKTTFHDAEIIVRFKVERPSGEVFRIRAAYDTRPTLTDVLLGIAGLPGDACGLGVGLAAAIGQLALFAGPVILLATPCICPSMIAWELFVTPPPSYRPELAAAYGAAFEQARRQGAATISVVEDKRRKKAEWSAFYAAKKKAVDACFTRNKTGMGPQEYCACTLCSPTYQSPKFPIGDWKADIPWIK